MAQRDRDPQAQVPPAGTPLGRPARERAERLHARSVEIEVPFSHVDALRIVWHGHYLEYFEQARTALLRARGLDEGDLIGRRYQLVVIESHCRHVAPLRYGDRLRATAWFRDYTRRLRIDYEIVELGSGRCAARGYTTLATLSPSGELLLRTPEEILRRIRD